MTDILSMYTCSGNNYINNPTTSDYTLTSEYLANVLFNDDDFNIQNLQYFNGITEHPKEINDQRFYGSGSAVITTPIYEIILCMYPRGDLRHNHVNYNMRWYLKKEGVIFRQEK